MPKYSPPPLKFPPAFRRRGKSSAAFSLIEVTLALGVVSFAFVAMFGLLPVGLQTFRKAQDTVNESRILQYINTLALGTDFNKLSGLDNTTVNTAQNYFFDDEGNIIPKDKEADPNNYLYKALVQIDLPKVAGITPRLPATSHLVRVNVVNVTAPTQPRLYTFLITKMDSVQLPN